MKGSRAGNCCSRAIEGRAVTRPAKVVGENTIARTGRGIKTHELACLVNDVDGGLGKAHGGIGISLCPGRTSISIDIAGIGPEC